MCSGRPNGCRHTGAHAEAGGVSCGCSGKMERFLEPCLLLLLLKSESHGYELLGRLQEFGLDPDQQDPGLMYRTLRRLERDGYLTSTWETESSGPARRLYRVTREGEELLHVWSDIVQRNIQSLESFLRSYREHFGSLTPGR